MSSPDLDNLLQPSLTAETSVRPPYSTRAGFLVAFFGGVYAALVFNGLNSKRLRRLQKDWWIYAAVALGWSFALIWGAQAIFAGSAPEWLSSAGSPSRTVRYAGRILALGVFGLMYLRHKEFYSATRLVSHEDAPNPWPAGLTAIGLSIAISSGLAVIAYSLVQQ